MSAKSYRIKSTTFKSSADFVPHIHRQNHRHSPARTVENRREIQEQLADLPPLASSEEGMDRWEKHFRYLKF